MSGWNSRNRLRNGAKHLCGQACLHKLADDFMVRVIAQKSGSAGPAAEKAEADFSAGAMTVGNATKVRAGTGEQPRRIDVANAAPAAKSATDTSLTPDFVDLDLESSVRLLPSPAAGGPVALPQRAGISASPAAPDEPPRFATRHWRAEAWERERERTQRGAGNRPEVLPRRVSER